MQLATYLPAFDNRTFDFAPSTFADGLRYTSAYLDAPDWLVYQWGMVGPLKHANHQSPLDLTRIVTLGLELHELSKHENFSKLIEGLGNSPQFVDTLFEIQVASFFSRLKGTTAMQFSPVHSVRGRSKSPEFDAETSIGAVSVECKRPHVFVQAAAERFRKVAREIRSAMERANWPRGHRLEVEMTGSLREQPMAFADRLVSAAADMVGSDAPVVVECARALTVAREAPFKLTDVRFGQDVMVLDSNEATGLFNPRFTVLRVVNNGLDQKFVRSAGARLAEALRQLPSDRLGFIFLGDVPTRIGADAAMRRLDDPAYDAVFAIGIVDSENWGFHFREADRQRLSSFMTGDVRPLYEPVV